MTDPGNKKFTFGTKAETLSRLDGKLKKMHYP